MVDMQLTTQKLANRGVRMLMQELQVDEAEAERLLALHERVR